MLIELPLDLLVQVALYLSTSEKLQLALTCKRLKHAIVERCLYDTLDLACKHEEETESVVLKFRKNKSKGLQVRVLRITLDHLSNQLLSEIPLIFPNVIEFNDYSTLAHSRPEETYSEFIKWKDTLICLNDSNNSNTHALFELMEKNIFSRLSYLNITCPDADKNHIDLPAYVKNAPALKELILEDYKITLTDLETIHSKCSLLKTLKIVSCLILVTRDDSLPEKITPALCMNFFILISTPICDQNCLFLKYLTQKYTKLLLLCLSPNFSESIIRSFFSGQDAVELDPNTEPNARRDELRLTREAISSLASSMLSNLSSTLRILLIPSLDIHDPMNLFSTQCVNLTLLDFIGPISPEDIKMLKNLPFLYRLHIVLDPSLQKHQQAPISTSVKVLKVIIKGESPQNDMNIGWILFMFPSLADLHIKYSGTRLVGYENDPPDIYPDLTYLSIGPSVIHPNMLPFIHNSAPNLEELHWWFFGKYVREKLMYQDLDQPVIIGQMKPNMEDGKFNYKVDLTGFSLKCFHLEIDLRMNEQDENGDILLELKDKHSKNNQCIISENFKCVRLVTDCDKRIKEKIKTRVTIQYDYTKMITINSKISIDLKKLHLQLNYHD